AEHDMNGRAVVSRRSSVVSSRCLTTTDRRPTTNDQRREHSMDRIAALTEILSTNSADSFARYGLAMEYSNAGDIERALTEFKTLLENTPDYTPGYFMAAQTLAKAARTDEAKRMLVDGISSALRTGNQHAQSEMTAMLEDLK